MKKDVFEYIDEVKLVPLSEGYRIEDFSCVGEIEYYNEFLKKEALRLSKLNISKTHLLISKKNADVMSYMSILCSQIKLTKEERESKEIPFGTCPVLKVGQLAVDCKYAEIYKNLGKLMIEFARGLANDLNNEIGIACKYVAVDANEKDNPGVTKFYERLGFNYNQKENERKNRAIVSMRLALNK